MNHVFVSVNLNTRVAGKNVYGKDNVCDVAEGLKQECEQNVITKVEERGRRKPKREQSTMMETRTIV